jgi:hypothetical protein
MTVLKFDLYGTPVMVSRDGDRWTTYYSGAEGKRRPAPDIVVPADMLASDVEQYLGDLCHEWATDRHPTVRRID